MQAEGKVEAVEFTKPVIEQPVIPQTINPTIQPDQIPIPAEPSLTTINQAAKVAVTTLAAPAVVPARIERRGRPRKISLGFELYCNTVKQSSTTPITPEIVAAGWQALEEPAKKEFEEKALLERDARNLVLRAAKASRFAKDSTSLIEDRKPRPRKSEVKYTDDSDRLIEADRFKNGDEEDDDQDFQVDQEEEEQLKKIERRGRPRKDGSSLTGPKPPKPSGEKKGRGRPRKIDANAVAVEEELKRKRVEERLLLHLEESKKVKKDDGLPDEEDVRDAILTIMKEENLETLTLNKIKQDLGVKFNFDSSLMKEFIKNTVDQLLATL
jgi:hypothetical protein